MLSKIYLIEKTFEAYTVLGDQPKELDNLSRVNIFVGANNSGKSRFLRKLFENKTLRFERIKYPLRELKNIIATFKADYLQIKRTKGFAVNLNIERYMDEIFKVPKYESFSNSITKNIWLLESIYENIGTELEKQPLLKEAINQIVNDAINKILPFFKNKKLYPSTGRLYIPILRGLRHVGYTRIENILPPKSENNFEEEPVIEITLNNHREDVYLERTIKDYFHPKDSSFLRIYSGLSLYDDLVEKLLGDREDRTQVRDFEDFLSATFFNGLEVNLVPKKKDGIVHVAIGDDEDAVHELGDGVQSIIALTYPMFFNLGEDMVFFIEEPEHCLHPGFQRIFMDVLMREEFKSFQYFITTHSNHLLDMTLDEKQVSIYTFQKHPKKKTADDKPTFTIENVDNAHTDILELLGVRTSSVFLTNCTIWVEGITDRLYIQQYLKVYQEHLAKINRKNLESNPNDTKLLKPIFKEDLHFSFVEYGGSNITHWSFLEDEKTNNNTIDVKRLCAKLFLISDQDGAGLNKDGNEPKIPSAKTIRHQKLEENLKERYYCLPVREIENLLSPEVLQSVLKTYEGEKGVTIPLFRYDVYKNMKLGNFIQNKLTGTSRTYKEDSGTIKDKVNFARKAIQAIERFDDLSPDAKVLVKKIYEFVKSQNEGQETISKS